MNYEFVVVVHVVVGREWTDSVCSFPTVWSLQYVCVLVLKGHAWTVDTYATYTHHMLIWEMSLHVTCVHACVCVCVCVCVIIYVVS